MERLKADGYTITNQPLPSLFPKGNYTVLLKNGYLKFKYAPGKDANFFDKMVDFSLFVDDPEITLSGEMSLETINQFATGKKTRLNLGGGKKVGVYPVIAPKLKGALETVLKELNFWEKRGFIRRAVLPAEIDNGTYKANYKDGILYAPTRYGGLLV